MLLTSSFAAVILAHAGGTSAARRADDDARVWVAQEQPAEAPPAEGEDSAGKNRPRNLPLTGPRRLLPRGTGMPAKRVGADDAAAAEQQGDAPPPPAPPPQTSAPGGGASGTASAAGATGAARGAGATSAQAPGARGASDVDVEARQKSGRFNFEFSKAEIMDVVKAISNLTRRNFIIPEKLKSQKITILSPNQITATEAYQVFLSALEANGITVVKAGKFYKLVESKESIKTTIPTCVGPEDECPTNLEQMVTILLRLTHVDGQQLQNVIKSLGGKEGEIIYFQPSNAIIISDYAPNIQRIRRIIEALDVPGFQDELQILQVEFATASEMAEKLQQIFDTSRGAQGAPARGGSAPPPRPDKQPPQPGQPTPTTDAEGDVQISKIIPDDRTNQLIIKANRRSFDAIKRLIAKLDIPVSDAEQGRVHVYYLENASAEELASTLSALAQGQATRPGQGGARPSTQPPGQQGTGAQPARAPETAALFEGDIKITADKATNSLLVMSSGRDFRALRRIIEQLDIARRQVYVEAAIMEVTVDDNMNYGTSWHAPARLGANDLPGGAGAGTIGFLQNPGNSGGISPTLTPLTNPASLIGIVNGSIVGLVGKSMNIDVGDNTLTLPSFGIVLRALQSSSNAQILSTPNLLTMDNEQASIEVGSKIPFRAGTSIPSGGGLGNLASAAGGDAGNALSQLNNFGSLFSSVQRIDVSLRLTLTPQINESDRIRLEIEQQIEDVTGTDDATGQPITSNRSAKTVVVVDDQQTIVLGGLMRDIRTEGESKIPLLGDIPIIGWLFKSKTRRMQKVNLVLVLTPYIIRTSDDFQVILERKVREYEEFSEEYYGRSPEYRAFIDYRKKSGPFARLAQAIVKAKKRAENGGEGERETVIKPQDNGSKAPEPRYEPATPEGEEPIVVPPELEGSGGAAGAPSPGTPAPPAPVEREAPPPSDNPLNLP